MSPLHDFQLLGYRSHSACGKGVRNALVHLQDCPQPCLLLTQKCLSKVALICAPGVGSLCPLGLLGNDSELECVCPHYQASPSSLGVEG